MFLGSIPGWRLLCGLILVLESTCVESKDKDDDDDDDHSWRISIQLFTLILLRMCVCNTIPIELKCWKEKKVGEINKWRWNTTNNATELLHFEFSCIFYYRRWWWHGMASWSRALQMKKDPYSDSRAVLTINFVGKTAFMDFTHDISILFSFLFLLLKVNVHSLTAACKANQQHFQNKLCYNKNCALCTTSESHANKLIHSDSSLLKTYSLSHDKHEL